MRKLPSWLASMVLHAALAALLSLIALTAATAEPDMPLRVRESRRTEPRMRPAPAPGIPRPMSGTVGGPDLPEFVPCTEQEAQTAPGRRAADHGASWNHEWTAVSVHGIRGGARFSGRGEGRRTAAGAGGGGDDTEMAVLTGLLWLARHQGADGSWDVQGHVAQCRGDRCDPHPGAAENRPGVTGLALLAFLGAGYSHLSTEVHEGIRFADVVKNGLKWILAERVKRREPFLPLYNHFLAAMAVCEAYGLTGSELLEAPAQEMVDDILHAQNRYSGWRYTPRSGDNDVSLTGMAALALKSAEWAGLCVPGDRWFEAKRYLDQITESDPYLYRVGYQSKGSVNVLPKSAGFRLHAGMTALGMAAHLMHEGRASERKVAPGAGLLLDDPPSTAADARDYFYWYYGSLALFQLDGPDGRRWRKWNDALKAALLPTQNGDDRGCRRGSWEPDDYWSLQGGRVFATAINCLTLEVYYRYPLSFGVRENK